MSSTITIPKTVEVLKTNLGGIDQLLTATQWEKAAIVYAWTTDGRTQENQRRVGKANESNDSLGITDFVAIGIVGLRSRRWVGEYRKAWQKAVDAGKASADIKPGDTVTLPDLPWLDYYQSEGGASTPQARERIAREVIAEKPAIVAGAMKALPQVADAAVAAVVDDWSLGDKYERMVKTKTMTGRTQDPGPAKPANIPDFAYEKALSKAIQVVITAIEDEESGKWEPDAGSIGLLAVLFLHLRDRAERIAAAQPAIHGDIAEFLASNRTEE